MCPELKIKNIVGKVDKEMKETGIVVRVKNQTKRIKDQSSETTEIRLLAAPASKGFQDGTPQGLAGGHAIVGGRMALLSPAETHITLHAFF